MRQQQLELRLRQERALWRSAQLRQDFVQGAQAFAEPLAQLDRLGSGVGWLRRHPLVFAALFACGVAVTSRLALPKAVRWWSLVRTLRGLVR
jgi:hypothetical protein